MANEDKNNKGDSSKNKRSAKSSKSNQKGKKPKKIEANKPDTNDCIGKSKELLMKKKHKTKSRKRQSSFIRIRPNGKRMHSLKYLNKMFDNSDADSDDDSDDDDKQPTAIPTSTPSQVPLNTSGMLIDPIDMDTISKVAKAIETAYMHHVGILSRKRGAMHCDEFDDLPQVMVSPSKKRSRTSDQTLINILTDNVHRQDTLELTSQGLNEENFSDISTDSNRTVEYNLIPSSVQSESVPQAFSPFPSTSRDNTTFIKNDELYHESLRKISKNLSRKEKSNIKLCIDNEKQEEPPLEITSEVDSDIKIIDCPVNPSELSLDTMPEIAIDNTVTVSRSPVYPTNTIDLVYGKYTKECNVTVYDDDDDIKIIDSHNSEPTQSIKLDKRGINCDEEDDDCVIVEASTTAKVAQHNEYIDLMCDFIENDEFKYLDGEVIDVDALIAFNQSVLDKYKKPEFKTLTSTNLIVDVSTPTATNQTSNQTKESNNNNQIITNETPTNMNNRQNQHNNELVIVEEPTQLAHAGPSNSHQFAIPPSPWQTFTETHLPSFLNNPYLPNAPQMFNNPSLNVSCYTPRVSSLPTTVKSPTSQAMASSRQKQQQASQLTNKETPSPSSQSPKVRLGECPICMDPLSGKEIGSTICGHVFCMSCLKQSIKAIKRCPSCRHKINKNGYHKIFL